MSNACHRIDIEPASLGERGRRYLVRHAGAVLVASSRNPEFDACRVLLAKGITGQLEVWHTGGAFPAMGLDITKGAGSTVEESDRGGPALRAGSHAHRAWPPTLFPARAAALGRLRIKSG